MLERSEQDEKLNKQLQKITDKVVNKDVGVGEPENNDKGGD